MQSKQEILKEAITVYGYAEQKDLLHEEMGELMLALNKYKRNPTPKTLDNVQEELADVKIMIEQMEIHFGKAKVNKWYNFKIKRLFLRKELFKMKKEKQAA